jgi:MarR family transcriptional regulator, lower aerobic nicotinate degradation pathway regulator
MSQRAKAINSPMRVAPSPPHSSAVAQRAHTEGGKEYHLEDQVGFILRRAHQRATGIFNSVMEQFSVTPTQFAVLTKLHDLSSVSQNELGRLTAMDPATIFGVVSRLIKRGFVVQSLDANDARLVILELTDAGRDAALAMKGIAAEVSRRTLEPLSAEDQMLFLQLLQRIAANGASDE